MADDLQNYPTPPAWWLAWTWAKVQGGRRFASAKAWASKIARDAWEILSTVAVVASLAAGAIFIPPQAAVWGGMATHAMFGWEQGAVLRPVLDTGANEAAWSAAADSIASEDDRKAARSAWRKAEDAARAAAKGPAASKAPLTIMIDAQALLAAGTSLASKRREAALSALVDSLAAGDEPLAALGKAKSALAGFNEQDGAGRIKRMLGPTVECRGPTSRAP